MNPRRIVKKIIPTKLFSKVEPYGHLLEAVLAQLIFGFPARNLKVIGVTGTDGKTSTASLIYQLLVSNNLKASMMTTISIDYGDGKGLIPNPTRLTTVSAMSLAKSMSKIKQSGAQWLVLETTSHALAQHRVWGIPYSIAVMTNINHEHLDYHKTFDNYLNAKRQLFVQTNSNRRGYQTGIINAEDKHAASFIRSIKHPLTYGLSQGDLVATNIKLNASGNSYTAKINGDEYHITCHLPGSFNISNSLAAVLVGRTIGLDNKQIEQGIAELKSVEGRMTYIDEGQDFGVIVDYAHTPDSFKVIFDEVSKITKGRIIGVFGSAGRRDEAKRATQGRIAGKFCDVVIATEEDDRDVDGQEILDQIASGAVDSGKKLNKDLFLIANRNQAIQTAINMAQTGDMVLLLGKGHEKSILSNGPEAASLRHLVQDDADPRRVVKRTFDEVTVARDYLRKRLAS
jgi:UDP-N-acetylmuramoyl-L-alanyl-D-glutamate--2,6-diaminopimelate ligase